MGSWYSTVMDALPVVESKNERLFPSKKATAAVTSDAKSVYESKQQFHELSQEGKVKLYKQQITHMDRETLKKVVTRIERDWKGNTSVTEFRSFKMLVESATEGWKFTVNNVEELEMSSDGMVFLYFKIVLEDDNTYNLAICHLHATVRATRNLVIGGMMAEGLLARDEEKKNIYLQFT